MCKIMIIPNITTETRDNALKFTKTMGGILSRDKSHQDGLGYAAIDSAGNLFAERWLTNDQAFHIRPDAAGMQGYEDFLDIQYSKFGNVKLDDITAVTLHTRLATSGKGLMNCHPFIEGDTSVIHNGVIYNANDFRIEQSTCDSESILTQYIDYNVGNDHELFNKVSNQLEGYYACGIFSRDAKGKRILDIVKSSSAVLVGAYVNELKSMVFTSLESHLQEGLKTCGFTTTGVFPVKNSSIVRVDPMTGKVIGTAVFSERVREVYKTPTTSTRYGYDWDNDWYKDYDVKKSNDPFHVEGEGYKAKDGINVEALRKAKDKQRKLKVVKR